jgi:Tfp pilus assembly protein PilF
MRDTQKAALVCLGLAFGTLLLYAPVLHFDFVSLDDPIYVSSNFHLSSGSISQKLAWCFQTGLGGYWMPMVWLSYLLDCAIGGFNPAVYHTTNVLFHAANSVLLFLLLKRMTGALWKSAVVAALFACHPVHVESVAWITERKDVLSTFFWFLAMLAYVNYSAKGGAGRYSFVLIFFALGLMAKPMLVTLPFVLLLVDWWPLGRFQPGNHKKLLWEKVPLLVMAVVFSAATAHLQDASGATSSLTRLPLVPRIENALVCYCRYVERTVWPARLSVLYPLHAWRTVEVLGAVIFLAAVSDRAFGFRKKFPYLLAGWIWFLLTLLPVIGIVQVGTQGMADRFNYVPSIGLFIMICWGAADLVQVWVGLAAPRRVLILTLAAAVAVIGCGMVAARQLQYWRNTGTLFRHAIDLDSNNFVAHASYGAYLADHGDVPEAILHLRRAVEIVPQFSYAHAFLGHTLRQAGQTVEAAAEIQTALHLNPTDVEARDELASILLDKRQAAQAQNELGTALQYAPDNPETHRLMGKALSQLGKHEEARAEFAEALRLNPQITDAHE